MEGAQGQNDEDPQWLLFWSGLKLLVYQMEHWNKMIITSHNKTLMYFTHACYENVHRTVVT